MYDRKKFCSAQNVTDVSFFCSGDFFCCGKKHGTRWVVNAPRLKVFGLLFGFHNDIMHQYGGSTIVVFDCNFLLVAYKA